MGKFKSTILGAAVSGFCAMSINAQSLDSVTTYNEWTVFKDANNAAHCYIVSTPLNSAAFKNGAEVSVNRGEIRLYIGVKNGATEPAFMAGYPLSVDKNPTLQIGDKVFNFFINTQVDQQFAWPDPKQDGDLISAMKAGAEAEMTGVSTRGTTTLDKFSLSGFTAAFNQASDGC